MTTIYEVAEIFNGRWLVFDEDQDEVEAQGHQCLAVSRLVNCAEIRDTIARTIVADNKVNQGDEQVLHVLAATIGQVSAEGVQDAEVLVR